MRLHKKSAMTSTTELVVFLSNHATGMRAAAALRNRTGGGVWGGLLRKTHTQVIEYPHIRLPFTSLN